MDIKRFQDALNRKDTKSMVDLMFPCPERVIGSNRIDNIVTEQMAAAEQRPRFVRVGDLHYHLVDGTGKHLASISLVHVNFRHEVEALLGIKP